MRGGGSAARLCQGRLTNLDVGSNRTSRYNDPLPHMLNMSAGSADLRVLVVDDDIELCQLLSEYLGAEGYSVEAVHTGRAGVERALEGDHAIVVLDVML